MDQVIRLMCGRPPPGETHVLATPYDIRPRLLGGLPHTDGILFFRPALHTKDSTTTKKDSAQKIALLGDMDLYGAHPLVICSLCRLL